ncbi:hypothetical protein SLOPH_2527 [Spraguea lophii 42_110]|uniref:Uncharacterized protein n=1 Tax=Spraguea lophii (strain 42_110) TaxID=1358809 RepID=S7W4Z9_SPRLO|nr:hypothetical protein SLOPH_2527 [Spraguea lophii 42_110]
MLEIKNKNNETLAICKIKIHQDYVTLRLQHSEFLKIIDQHIKYGILYFEVFIPKSIGYTGKSLLFNKIENPSDYYLTGKNTDSFCSIKILPASNFIKRILKNLSKFVMMLEIKNKNNETLLFVK